jgi:two-component system invasion response regulator UvrY
MIRLLVADDHKMFRQGVIRLLADQADLQVVAEASTSAEVVDALHAHQIDVALLDLSMPGRGGADLIGYAKTIRPSLRILAITMHDGEPHVTQTLRAGADGYLTKESAADELLRAIRKVAAGGRYLCATVAERLAQELATRGDSREVHLQLTQREYRIFEMLVAGRRGWEIAQELSLSEKTVSSHKTNVLRKMNMTNRTELVRYAIKHGLMRE